MAHISTHNGKLTVRSTATGEHRTFEFRTQPDDAKFAPGRCIVSLLIGSNNQADYKGFAFLDRGETLRVSVWKKHRGTQYEALARMLEQLDVHEQAGRVTLHFETCCRKCNRPLTTPESVESGIGPVCAGRVSLVGANHMFVPGNDLIKARKWAEANADSTGVDWVIFRDTSGNLRIERYYSGLKDYIEIVSPDYPRPGVKIP